MAKGGAAEGFLLGWLAPGLHVEGLNVATGLFPEDAEDIEAGVIAVAEVMKGKGGREALEEGDGPGAGIAGLDEEIAGLKPGEFVEGGFVFDGDAAGGGGVDGKGALDVLKGEPDGAVKDPEVERLVIELELERAVDQGEARVWKNTQVVEGLDPALGEICEDPAECAAERSFGVAWGEGFEPFGISAQDTTDEADKGFALPGEQAWQEFEQLLVPGAGKAVERFDGLAEQGCVVQALAPAGPVSLPGAGHGQLGGIEELIGQLLALAGG